MIGPWMENKLTKKYSSLLRSMQNSFLTSQCKITSYRGSSHHFSVLHALCVLERYPVLMSFGTKKLCWSSQNTMNRRSNSKNVSIFCIRHMKNKYCINAQCLQDWKEDQLFKFQLKLRTKRIWHQNVVLTGQWITTMLEYLSISRKNHRQLKINFRTKHKLNQYLPQWEIRLTANNK